MSTVYTVLVLAFILFIITVQIRDLQKEEGRGKRSLSLLILLTCLVSCIEYRLSHAASSQDRKAAETLL